MNRSPGKNACVVRSGLTLVAVGLATTLCACASLKPQRMVPALHPQSDWTVGRSVRVAEITSDQKSRFGGAAVVSNEMFGQALLPALQKSGLFTAVDTQQGDLDLQVAIRSQGQRGGPGLQYTATMVASYKFSDRSGNIVWLESYESEFSSVALAGASRTVEAREGAVRENLSAFISGIRERWPKQ